MSSSQSGSAMPASPSLVDTTIIVLAVVLPILDTAAVGLRFYLRRGVKQGLQADDWVILAALIVCWGLVINTYTIAGIGGVNTTTLDPVASLALFNRGLWISWFFICSSLGLVKISALFFYCRIFSARAFRLVAHSMVGVLVLYSFLGIIVGIFTTSPVSAIWNNPAPHYNFNTPDFYLAFSGINVVLDLIVIVMPLPLLGRLQIDVNRKLQVFSIFLIASFCAVASALRFYFSFASDKQALGSSAENKFIYAQKAFLWVQIEPLVSVIAVCLPTYGSLYYKVNGRGLRSIVSFFQAATSLSSRNGSFDKSTAHKEQSTGDISQSSRSGSSDSTGVMKSTNDIQLTEPQQTSVVRADSFNDSLTVEAGVADREAHGIRVTKHIMVEDTRS